VAPTDVCVFSPSPLLTVTIERERGERERGERERGEPERDEGEQGDGAQIHVHPGGQGVWVARMARRMGAAVRLVGAFGGEAGLVARLLVHAEGIDVACIELDSDSSAYVHDRRRGERVVVAESPFPTLERHALDELYTATLAAALEAGVCVLAGTPEPAVLPNDTYRRLGSDLRGNRVAVLADLRGEQLHEALGGGLSSLKVSHEELEADGLLDHHADVTEVVRAATTLCERGADDVLVSRAAEPAVASIDGDWYLVRAPNMQVVDHRGAGDSMTAALAVAAARSLPRADAVRLAAAAGSLNVTRHGLATGHVDAIEQLAQRVELDLVRP
jgi:1-phosphofructokinase